jgi:membrane glycosyltransferase
MVEISVLNEQSRVLSSSAAAHVSDSHTREVDPVTRAARRVAEFLRAQGVTDEARVSELSQNIAAVSANAGEAISLVQSQVASWRSEVFGPDADAIEPLWLRAFAAAHPAAFLGDVATARAAVQAFGDPREGRAPTRARFHSQAFERVHLPRWLLCMVPPVGFTAGLTLLLLGELSRGGFSGLELVFSACFAVLALLGALGLWTAWLGFAKDDPSNSPVRVNGPLPRTALLMPIYHEDAEHVFAALMAMRESLSRTPGGEAFEMFVLSDSRLPERAAEEERAFRRVAALSDTIPVYYRRRVKNERQKAGNLAEFFERWGQRYEYAVILDADSLMKGETLVELVRRMEAAPETALIQAPLSLHGGRTLFARGQQLATSVHGPVLTRGLSRWAGPTGNYFGHNAIVRTRAFLECCALPTLAGKPPFGGHILSHDFVEAALLCRAGWQVRIAHDLTGSWEELPPTLPEYVARDRRWCQGNFQHLRIAFAQGLKPMSRLYMLVGAFMYLASPIWLAFVVVGAVLAHQSKSPLLSPLASAILLGATASVLFGPRLFGWLATLRNREQRRAHGGALRLTASVLGETWFATLLSPILMLHHTRIVASIVLGKAIGWGSQNRRGAGQLGTIVRAELFTTLAGVGSAALLWHAAPELLWWLSPLWVSWVLAIPLVMLASSELAGSAAKKLGLLVTPPESAPDELCTRADELRALTGSDEVARFRDLVRAPVLLHSHLARLGAACSEDDAVLRTRQRALRVGPAALSDEERALLMACPESMRALHREAWQHWPVETWQLGRDLRQLPPDAELAPRTLSA